MNTRASSYPWDRPAFKVSFVPPAPAISLSALLTPPLVGLALRLQ